MHMQSCGPSLLRISECVWRCRDAFAVLSLSGEDAKRGFIVNVLSLATMAVLSVPTGLGVFAVVALLIQWTVFFFHGLPWMSEQMLDVSAAMTYLSLSVVALLRADQHGPRQIVNVVFVIVWSTRLGSFLTVRASSRRRKDRFTSVKGHWLQFLALWTTQSVWVWIVASPVLLIASSMDCGDSLGLCDVYGWVLWFFGFFVEAIADTQKHVFRSDPANATGFITSGMWALSRHPNYFGEICMWLGICLSGSGCFSGADWLVFLSPVTVYLLLTRVNGVPQLEKHGDVLWGHLPEYKGYKQRTPCIVPLPTPKFLSCRGWE